MTSTSGSAPTASRSGAERVTGATWLVAQREVVQGLHSQAFRISVVLSVVLVAVLGFLPALLDSDDDPPRYRVAVVERADDLAGALAAVAPPAGVEVELVRAPTDRTELERALREGRLDAAVVGDQVLADGTPPDRLVALLEGGNAIATQAERARRAGLGADETAALLAPTPPLTVVSVTPDETEPAERGVAAVAVIGLFLALAFYGGAVMNGVLQEKSSRVVEVVLAAVSPRQLLTGKLAGIGLLGLGQVALIGLAALVSTQVAGTAELPSSTPATIGLAVLWFVLGYALYASLFAMAGSLISRQEDAQAAATPVTLLITAFYMVALLAVLPAPDGLMARICTFIPLAAPTTVLARVALGQIAAWEVALSALLMVAAIVVVVRLAARVYAGAALHAGARLPWRTAFRAGAEPVTARPPAGSAVR